MTAVLLAFAAALVLSVMVIHGPYRRRLDGRLREERTEERDWVQWVHAMRSDRGGPLPPMPDHMYAPDAKPIPVNVR